jgi:hypothetical protein
MMIEHSLTAPIGHVNVAVFRDYLQSAVGSVCHIESYHQRQQHVPTQRMKNLSIGSEVSSSGL